MRLGRLRRISVLMATVFLDMVGFSMVLTQLPYLALRSGLPESLVGPLISAFALAQLATAPLWGRMSDRFGRRPAILAGLAASATAFALFGLAATNTASELLGPTGVMIVLVLSRLAQGTGGGTIGVVQAYVSDSTERSERAEVLAWVTAATSAGVMIGPTIGSLAFRLGPAAPGFVAAALCLADLLFAWRWLPEPARRRAAPGGERPSLRGAVWSVFRHPLSAMHRLIWIYAVGMLAFMSLNGVLVLYLERAFGIDEISIGWFYAYIAGAALVMRGFLLGPTVRALGELRTLRLGVLLVATGLFAIPLARGVPSLAVVALFLPVGTAMVFPVTTSLVSQRSKEGETGQTLGVQQAFGGLARLIGPAWSTFAFAHIGIAWPFWIAGGVTLVGLYLALRLELDELPAAEDPSPA